MPLPRRGQSVIEVLVGIAISAFFIIGAAGVIAPALRSNTQATQVQTRAGVGKELVDNLRSWAAGNWNGIAGLATGSANTYYLSATSSPFAVVGPSAVESLILGTTTYARYFYLSDVYRDGSGNLTTTITGTNYDPSTKLATVVVRPSTTVASYNQTSTVSFYLTRNSTNALTQSSWAGGSGQSTPVTLAGTKYATSSKVTIAGDGSIQLYVAPGGACVY